MSRDAGRGCSRGEPAGDHERKDIPDISEDVASRGCIASNSRALAPCTRLDSVFESFAQLCGDMTWLGDRWLARAFEMAGGRTGWDRWRRGETMIQTRQAY